MERKDIYRERECIEEFGVDEKNTINKAIFDVLFQIGGVSRNEETILGLFNDAYYICTLILLEKRPYFNIEKYQSILEGNNLILPFSHERVITIMSMVAVYLKSIDMKTDDNDKVIKAIKTRYSGCDGNIYETITAIVEGKNLVTKAFVFYPLHFPANDDYSDFWKTYQNLPAEMSNMINGHIETWIGSHMASEEEVRQIVRNYGKRKEQGKSLLQQYKDGVFGGNIESQDQHKEELSLLRSEVEEWKGKYQALVAELNCKPEEAFNPATKNRCFSKAQVGLLVYTIASIKDGPIPVKTDLVPIISSICGSEQTSTDAAMRYAGFKKADIDYVAKVFENAMPHFAEEIKKQPERRPKEKK